MSINTQSVVTKKPKASAKVKVHAKAPAVKAKTSLGLKGKVGVKGKVTGKAKVTAKPKAKLNIKVKGKTPKVTKPKAKLNIKLHGKTPKVNTKAKGKMHVKLHLGGKAKASTKGKAHMKIKIHGKATKKAKKTSKCTAKFNVFGLKLIQGDAITKDTACGLKESCVKAADFKAATAKINAFANKLGSWIWSKQTLAKWINFAMTKVDYTKAAGMCGVAVAKTPAKPSTDKPKAKVNVKVNAKAKAAPKKRILQAVKAKAKAPKAKVSVKAKAPKAKVSVKAKVPKVKVNVKAKKPAVKAKGKMHVKLHLGGKAKASTKGKAHMKVTTQKKSSVKVHVKVKSAKRKFMTLGMKGSSKHTGVQWDDLMIKNAKCNGIFVKQFMPLAKKCAPFQSYYGRAVRKCAKSIYKLRKNLMCESTRPSKVKAFESGMPKLSNKFWGKSKIRYCLTAAMFEQMCIRPQLKAMNDALQSTGKGKTNFATKIAAWEQMSGTKKSSCVNKMTNLFNGKKAKVHLKLKVHKKSSKKSGLKLKLHSKTKAKSGLKLKVKAGAKKPKAKAGLKLKVKGKTSAKPKAKAGLKLKVKGKASAKPKAKAGLKLKVKAHKKDRILQAIKAKGKAKAKVSVKAKKPKAKVSVKAKVPKVKVNDKAKKPAVKGKAGLKLKLGGKAKASTKAKGKAGLKLKLGGKAKTSSKAKGKMHVKLHLGGKAKKSTKGKTHIKVKIHKKKAFKSQWYAMLKKLGKFKWGAKLKLTFSNGGNCLSSMTPFLLSNLRNPVVQFQDTRFVYDLLDQSIAAWGSEADVASYWKKFFIAALKDEKSYTSATAAAPVKPKVKVTVKGKTDAAKKPAAKKDAKKDTKKADTKKDAKKPAAKKDEKKTAKKDDKKKRRMQATTSSSSSSVDPTETSSKDAGVEKVDVKPAPGQETPFDASAKLISLSVVTALLVAFM
jgi:hypothetical protein